MSNRLLDAEESLSLIMDRLGVSKEEAKIILKRALEKGELNFYVTRDDEPPRVGSLEDICLDKEIDNPVTH